MKSWNVGLVLSLKIIVYGYENNETVNNHQLHKFLSEYIEKLEIFVHIISLGYRMTLSTVFL